jgi:hypothetical protein
MAADTTRTLGASDANADDLRSPPFPPSSAAQAQADDGHPLDVGPPRGADRFRADAAARSGVADPRQQLSHRRAYNQDPGVVQHIQTFSRATRGGDWLYTFTEEWPAPGIKHQLSYTVPMARFDGERGIGDVALNYRYQWIGDADAKVAIAPRFTVLLPTGNERRGLGSGGTGVQVMLPASTVLTPSLIAHWNLSATLTPKTHTHNITAGNSFVWLANHRFNVLVETLWSRTSNRNGHDSQNTISPGIRWSYDFPSKLQIVPGLAFPITNHGGGKSVFLYLSFEHPFVKQP